MESRVQAVTIKARLPYVDRRALSQAWYGALHLAAQRPAVEIKRGSAQLSASQRTVRAALVRESHALRPTSPDGFRQRKETARVHASAAPVARRSERDLAAVTLAQARVHRREAHALTTFTVAFQDARIQIHLRRDGARTQILALCSPVHVRLVQQSLAGVELALRASGFETASRVVAAGGGT